MQSVYISSFRLYSYYIRYHIIQMFIHTSEGACVHGGEAYGI